MNKIYITFHDKEIIKVPLFLSDDKYDELMANLDNECYITEKLSEIIDTFAYFLDINATFGGIEIEKHNYS